MANKGTRVEMDMGKLSNAVEGKKRNYPSMLALDEGDLPEVKDWKVGQKYKVMLTIKMVKSEVNSGDIIPYDDDDANKVHGRFEVVKVESEDPKEEKAENYKEEK